MRTPRQRRQPPREPLELVEEAIHLLRVSPATLAANVVGTLPFAAGVLYFWADMSRGAYADRRCAVDAFALAALYVWMKTWQTIFARSLWSRLSGEPTMRWTPRRVANVAILQAVFQPTSIIILPVAAVLTVPFVWAYSFYQNLTIIADGETAALRATASKARRLAWMWTGQNHFAIAATWFFGLFVFLDIYIAVCLAPHLVKMLLGVETVFTRSSGWMMNTTTVATVALLTWLCISPLTRAINVLRCFYGDSVRTGQDLRAELRAITTAAMLVMVLFFAAPARAETTTVTTLPSSRAAVSPPELDRNIERVLQQDRYTWRFPREHTPQNDERGWFSQFVGDIGDAFVSGLKWCRDQFRKVYDWIRDLFPTQDLNKKNSASGVGWTTKVRVLLYVLIVLVVALLGVLFWRAWRQRRVPTDADLQPEPDIAAEVADENVTADQRPEDDWLARARQLLADGNLRLAVRAYYLAMLAHLGSRDLISIARYKSNREYERELARRARAHAALNAAFRANRRHFEDAWYGLHEVTPPMLDEFQTNIERIRTDGTTR